MSQQPAEFPWSPQQQAVFGLFLATVAAGTKVRPGPRNVVVRARAGTGKTTTIIELIRRVLAKWPRLAVVACAFNKEIQGELEVRLPPGATAKTLHALGLAAQNAVRRVKVDNGRDQRLAEAVCPNAPRDVVRLVEKLANLGKDCLPLCQGPDELTDLQLSFDLIADDISEVYTDEWIREKAYAAMLAALEFDGTCSFSDMVYVAVRLRMAKPIYDMVLVDEAQDMNAGQLLLSIMLCKPTGRIVVVGDDRQGIYTFRGADSDALDRLKRELGAVEVPLTVTRRCPKAVVALARAIVPDFVAADEAPEGTVDSIGTDKLTRTARPGDFVLSRTNAPLVAACLKFVAAGIPARVRGRNIGKGLIDLINRAKAHTLDDVEEYLAVWSRKQLAKLNRLPEERAEQLAEEIEDKVEALKVLIADADSVDGLVARIESLFSDDKTIPAVLLSTVHKAKGLEADHVFLLKDTFTRRGHHDEPSSEEANIQYVAITRAKSHLTWVA